MSLRHWIYRFSLSFKWIVSRRKVQSQHIWALVKNTTISKIFRGGCLIDPFVVRPVWILPSARLNLRKVQKRTFSHRVALKPLWIHPIVPMTLSPREDGGGIGLAAYGRNWENNYLLINDLYWQPGRAHLRRWQTSPGLNGFYSRLNYFSLAIVPSRGACAMSTICGLNARSKVLRHLHSSKMPWDAGRFSIFKMFQKLSYWGTASPFTSDYTWNLSSFYFFSASLRLKKNQ